MPTQEEKLEQELASLKKERFRKAQEEADKLKASVNEERSIKLADGTYKLTFVNHDASMMHPKDIVKALTQKAVLVRHEFDGEVRDVLSGTITSMKGPRETFEPIDKGRPSTVFCNASGLALFSFAVYDNKELTIYPIGEVHAW